MILPRPCSWSSDGRRLRWRGLLISKQTIGKHFQRRNSGKKCIKHEPKSRACFQQNFLWKKWEGFQIRKSQYKCGELIWLSWDEAWECQQWKSAKAPLEYQESRPHQGVSWICCEHWGKLEDKNWVFDKH